MFEVGVQREFIASHALTTGDFGPESKLHSHHYRLEVTLRGRGLDGHGFLFDISQLESGLGALIERWQDRTLNDLDEFAGLNTSVEQVAQACAEHLQPVCQGDGVEQLRVRVWENESAWASYTVEMT